MVSLYKSFEITQPSMIKVSLAVLTFECYRD